MKNLQKLRFVILLVILMLLTFIGFASEQYTFQKPTLNFFQPFSGSYTITVMNDTELHQLVGNGNYADMTVNDFNTLIRSLVTYQVYYLSEISIIWILIVGGIILIIYFLIRDNLKYKKLEMKDFDIYVSKKDWHRVKEYMESLKSKE